jgi:hypothetical protein
MPLGHLASQPARRGDTVVASAVLLALIAGWILNFVSARDVAQCLDSLIVAAARAT